MSEKSDGSESSAVIDSLANEGLKWLLTFLFTVALVGGFNFLLVTAEEQSTQIRLQLRDNDSGADEYDEANRMLGTFKQGWLGNSAQWQKLNELETGLEIASTSNPLGNTVISQLNWIDQSLVNLSTERGVVSGYFFTDDYFKSTKSAVIASYNATSQYLQNTENIIQDWAESKPEARKEGVRTIRSQWLMVLENSATELKAADPDQVKARGSRITNDNSELLRSSRLIEVRSSLAWIGIGSGILVALGIVMYSTRKFTNARIQSRKPDANPKTHS